MVWMSNGFGAAMAATRAAELTVAYKTLTDAAQRAHVAGILGLDPALIPGQASRAYDRILDAVVGQQRQQRADERHARDQRHHEQVRTPVLARGDPRRCTEPVVDLRFLAALEESLAEVQAA